MSEQTERIVQAALGNPSRYNVSAKFYDLEYGELKGSEREFYLELASQQAGPILELGCGTGRVALPLAQAGHNVTALDLSEHMLGEFQRKLEAESAEVLERITLKQGSMDDFKFEQHFGLITVPFRAFQHLQSVEQQRRCLGLVREHLAEDGVFVFDVFNPSLEHLACRMQHKGLWLEDLVNDLPDGGQLRRAYQMQPLPTGQVMELTFRYEETDSQGRLIRTEIENAKLRWLYRFEAEHLFELCGLEILASYQGYDKSPIEEQAKELIYLLKRAESTE